MVNQSPWPEYKTNLGIALVLLLYENGFPMHRIAALFDTNQGRISEIITRHRKGRQLGYDDSANEGK